MKSPNNLTKKPSFPPLDLSKYTQQGQSQDIAGLYESLSRQGYHYGKDWQVIKNIWKYQDKWLLEIRVPTSEPGSTTSLNPALLDGLFQSVLAIEYFFAEQPSKNNTLHVPYLIKKIDVLSEVKNRCFICLDKQDIQTKGGDIYAQLRAYNADGERILQIQEMVFKQVSTQFLSKNAVNKTVSDQAYCYQPKWVKRALSPQTRDLSQHHAIVFMIDNRLETQTLQEITPRYQKSFIINKGSAFARQENDCFEINITQEQDYVTVLQQIVSQPVNHPIEGYDIYYLWAYTPEAFSHVDESERNALIELEIASLFFLTKALSTLERKPTINLLVATHHSLIVTEPDRGEGYGYGSLFGLAQTVRLENPSLTLKIVDFAQQNPIANLLLDENISQDTSPRIAYRDQERYVQAIEPVSLAESQYLPLLKDNGVYLLMGGLGRIGFQIAALISQQVKARLVIIGRSKLSKQQQQRMTQLQNTGSEVLYIQADVANPDQMEKAIQRVKQQYTVINGVIQASGVLEDKLLINKDWPSFQRVLAPKVPGTMIINQLTQTEPLDFFIVFSSIVAITGNIGQADYAAANSFLDSFIHYRSRNDYPGKSLSINWTLWAEGGMGQNPSVIEAFAKKAGVISNQTGINTFAQLLNHKTLCQCIVAGRSQVFESNLANHNNHKLSTENKVKPVTSAKNNIKQIQKNLIQLLSQIIDAPPSELDIDTDIREYGLDSISLTDYADKINQHFDLSVNPTLFYEFPNLQILSEHLNKRYGLKLTTEEVTESFVFNTPPLEKPHQPSTRQSIEEIPSIETVESTAPQEVAIIGMSGRFPGANNLATFWENLIKEKDLISEIPEERWDWRTYFGDPLSSENKTNSKWGGFLDDVKSFNAAFFHISPREAELMDPQQRLLLEEVWHVIEESGYNPKAMSGTDTGIFIGVCNDDYNDLLLENNLKQDAYTSTGSYFSIIPNRISYFLDMHGPSVAIDTACSSSLVALHQAVQALADKDCTLAIAGGINLCLTPKRYCSFSHAGMLSPEGRCKTFDKNANGYVRGEGVGILLLKPLSNAVADGDHIYGIIKGSAVNHGGFSNSLTAPNPNAQAALLVNAYQKAKIPPETVTYIEAHGTGTSLGDPIEINGLKAAFEQLYQLWDKPTPQQAHCGIGAVKTNIGHLESAAGIAGVIKVLLAMKHQQLPASINFNELNPYIQLSASPFFIVNQTQSWERLKNAENQPIPRRAGVSSFGFGGTNAHIVLEEYVNPTPPTVLEQSPQLIVLSAKNSDRLTAYLNEIIAWLENNTLSLADFAYTLQVGRDAMEERLAMVVASLDEVQQKLTQYTQGQTEIEDFYRGNVKNRLAQNTLLIDGKAGQAFLRVAIEEKELTKLAQLWISGIDIDWQLLYPNHQPQRLSLPTYPFARERYWISESKSRLKVTDVKGQMAKLHPLLESNTSTFRSQQFTSKLTGNEFYLTDHVIGSQKTLPGVAILEMARAAGELAGEQPVMKLSNIVWARPIIVSDTPKTVHISLFPQQQQVEFEVTTLDDNQRQVHAQGQLTYRNHAESETVDIEAIQNRCVDTWNRTECYKFFQANGLNYGPGFQTIQTLHRNDSEALSHLLVPSELKDNDWVLHPSLMDGALQTVISLMDQTTTNQTPYLPFALGDVELLGPLSETCYAYVRRTSLSPTAKSSVYKFNISILSETGQEQVRLKDFSIRALKPAADETPVKMYYQSVWEPSRLDNQDRQPLPADGPILLFDTDDNRCSSFKERLTTEVILVTPGESYQALGPQTYVINPNSPVDYRQLLTALTQQNQLPSHIIHLWSQTPFVTDERAVNAQLNLGLYSIFHLSQALLEQKWPKSIQLLYVYLATEEALQPQYAALNGFIKTIRLEHSKLNYKTVAISSRDKPEDIVLTEFKTPEVEVRYENGQRWIKRWQEFDSVHEASTNRLKENGVYLITGGAGGLGLIFAEYLAKNFKAKLVLTGRSELTDEQTQKIQSLNTLGAEVIYLPANISKRDDVAALITQTKSHFNEIHGIIHSAGVRSDALIIKKTTEEMATVLAPKVYGTIYLDEFTQNDPLDFFMLFSSVAAVMGNIGQCDYAYANSFMDNFALWREGQRAFQKRSGKTLSINWPLWQSGGMQVDEQTANRLLKTMGMQALSTETGLEAFSQGLAWKETNQFVVIEGYRQKVNKALGLETAVSKPTATTPTKETDQSQLLEKLQADLLSISSAILKVSAKDIEPTADISEYGFDSISFTELANQINDKYQLEITPAIFFEYLSVSAFSQFLYQEYQQRFLDYYRETLQPVSTAVSEVIEEEFNLKSRFQRLPIQIAHSNQPPTETTSIAIIGMSGIMPQSADLDSFWQHLEAGDDLITEVPFDRWDWQAYDSDDSDTQANQVKWGGFMPEVDKFDPLFFGISPREAELMDPQQRLFLETVWKTIEDAGYKASDLSGTNTGVFVGVATSDYSELLRTNAIEIEAHTFTGTVFSTLANRVSYLLNLHGPSEPIDTACSSALVAVHRAVGAILSGACEMAIAGGVNVILTPSMTLSFSKAGMLSENGRCQTFDKRANGYVRGEGVGAIWLKPLTQAQADGDQIYAVIKGSAENHGGHATSFTAPNPNAQTKLLISAYEEAHIEPSSLSYIETHGTGTPLGDPIEINALKNAFAKLSNGKSLPEQPHCGIGSVKTNIGHLEAAAGIAGIFKVLLALKHQILPKNLHFSELNPYIQLQDSPFYIVTNNQTWTPLTDTSGQQIPRRAGVSSFGFGGANAHIVLEEYIRPTPPTSADSFPQLIVLSAKNADRLTAYINEMVVFLEKKSFSLANFAYTLQVGREAMAERLAMVVSSPDEVRDKLTQYTQGQTEIEDFYRGNVKNRLAELLIEGEEGKEFVNHITTNNKLTKLAQLWVSGVEIDWQLLSPNQKPQRLSLPTYPFARERYWIPTSDNRLMEVKGHKAYLHPLLDSNESTLEEQCFKKVFVGDEFYLTDHQVGSQRVLPAVVYLEMARAAGNLANRKSSVNQITNLVWAKPIIVSDRPLPIHISFYPDKQRIEFQVTTIDDSEHRQVHAQGKLIDKSADLKPTETIDISAIQNRCAETWDREKCYQIFQAIGINYGPSFQTIQILHRNDHEALSLLQLPNQLTDNFNEFVWHPSLMDGALQTLVGLMGQTSTPYLPFALGEVELLGPLSETCYAYVSWASRSPTAVSSVNRFNISILDETGQVQVRLSDCSVRSLKQSAAETPIGMYYSVWQPSILDDQTEQYMPIGPILLFDTDDNRHSSFKEHLTSQVILVTPGESYQVLSPDTYSINPNQPADYQQLLAALTQLPSHIIHLWSQTPFGNSDAELNAQLSISLFSIFHLSQALLKQKPIEPIQLLYIYLEPEQQVQPQYAALSGFAKTIRLENPKLNYKTLALPTLDQIVDIVLTEFQVNDGIEIRYNDNQRWVKHLQEIDEASETPITNRLKEHGVYLITGGAGGLGLILAEYLAKHFKARLVLTGRSALNNEQTVKIQSLNSLDAEVIYQKADISKRDEVSTLIAQTKSRFNQINGIIHCAGVVKDALVVKKTTDEMAAVLAPKVYGTVYLDEVTQNEPLDFFILFSSMTAVRGNLGQCDYAYANGFMDNFAFWRDKQRNIQKRLGKTLSINWPLWREGGMKVDEETERWMNKRTGLVAIKTEAGLNLFNKVLALDIEPVVAISGQQVNTHQSYVAPTSVKQPDNHSDLDLPEKVEKSLLALCSELLKVKEPDLDIETDFGEYGMDSIMMMNMLNRIEATYGSAIEPNAIAEYPTIKQLASYLITQNIVKLETSTDSIIPTPSATNRLEWNQPQKNSLVPKPSTTRFIQSVSTPGVSKIAVISMAGRFPGASNLEKFWDNLIQGKKSIIEVPEDRWKVTDYYTPNKNVPNKTYSKWAGYIEDIDQFDAAYFGISDTDALVMDPQQRILLELTQELLDRAGYRKTEIDNRPVSVFIGGAESAYLKNNQDQIPAESRNILVNTIQNMMAARISDYYNFTGPSLTTDTACSSSLVSIHQACQSLMQGESELAIAGGIELLIDPFPHLAFSKAEVLSDEDESYIFDQRAKGIVLGEGAGLVLLKPLDKAIAEGDPILGVINGSAINNDGHTMGLTVPNLDGQKAVIMEAIEKSTITPATITYLEAHGTGTLLGDPIEIKAISQVYRTFTQERQYCAIGSVKSNIGHLLHAAGIASFIKVLLALQHRMIPPTLNCEKPHPRFNFEESPGYPITQAAEWQPKNGSRCAAISSFGFGGTNCHLMVEEFSESKYRHYVQKRSSFSPTPFHRKRYWLGTEIAKTFEPSQQAITGSHQAIMQRGKKTAVQPVGFSQLKLRLEQYIAGVIEKLLQLSAIELDREENFMDLGVDSTQLIQLTQQFEQSFNIELYPTLFFEYQNIKELAEYLSQEYTEILAQHFNLPSSDTSLAPETRTVAETPITDSGRVNGQSVPETQEPTDNWPLMGESEGMEANPIAVIGMAGVFADSPNLEAFWTNLRDKKNLIQEIPADHFDYQPWFDPNSKATDKIYCKWGSFIDDVAQFDAGFFNISPREAERMDPQLRLLLQVLYTTAEDAGYPQRLKGTKTGMYVGVCFHDYADEMARQGKPIAPHDGTGNAATMMANRPSFYFNLTGPSIAVDTACSSSLVALHLAAKALQNNECDMAFAAGTNLLLGSSHYRYFCSLGALSHTGRCHTFDKRADGYVPGEGVGAILLKPLAKAIADGDLIHAVIRGSAINHGGYTPSITAPSANLEAQVILEAWRNARINPETLGYIEAHGTGTKLGDPVEINGLKKAFNKHTDKEQFCAVGSAKAHLGHTEGAAGIAGVIKVILSLKHQQIPAMPMLNELNPYIQLEGSPLYINRELERWNRTPRRAGVSSFGFGGAYGHVVLEEYDNRIPATGSPDQAPQLIVLSAKNEARLKVHAQQMAVFLEAQMNLPGLEKEEHDLLAKIQSDLLKIASKLLKISDNEIDLDQALSDYGFDTVSLTELCQRINDKYPVSITLTIFTVYPSLATVAQYLYDKSAAGLTLTKNRQAHFSLTELAYTLQVGREAMTERLAMVVSSPDEVRDKLTQYVQGQTEIDGCYRGNVKTSKSQSELLIEGEAGEAFLRIVIEKKELTKLAQLWISGIDIDWQLLYPNQKPQRILLPTYPFAPERYWIPISEKSINRLELKDHKAQLHPLLDSNESTLEEQCFKKVFVGDEFYLTDHQLESQRVMPAVVYLEMARAAGNLANKNSSVNKLTNLVWAMPITVYDQPVPVHISLFPEKQQVEFEVSTTDDNGKRQVHAQGQLNYGNPAFSAMLDIEAIQNRCVETWDSAKCYQLFQTTGLNYGPSFQTIQTLYRNDTEALSHLQLPKELLTENNSFVLHPSLMDGALQTVIGLMGQTTTPYLPFALGKVELLNPLSETCYAYVRRVEHSQTVDSAVNKFNISILDETGQEQVRLSDFSFRALKPQTETPVTMYYQSVWEPKALESLIKPITATGLVLLFDIDDTRYPSFKDHFKGELILVTPGESYQELDTQTYSINPNQSADYQKLLFDLNRHHEKQPSHIIYLWSQSVNDDAALNAQIEMSLFSIFHLSQAILKQKPSLPIQLLYVYLETEDARQPQYAALSGFAKTIGLENPKLSYKTVALPILDNVVEIVEAEFQTSDIEIRYEKGQRWVKRLQDVNG